jgi:hypothetical protein
VDDKVDWVKRKMTVREAIHMENMVGQQELTLRSALGGDVAGLVDLDLRALPRDIKVRLDGHVVCRRSEESLVGRGSEGRSTRAECRKRCGAKLVGLLHDGGWRGECANLRGCQTHGHLGHLGHLFHIRVMQSWQISPSREIDYSISGTWMSQEVTRGSATPSHNMVGEVLPSTSCVLLPIQCHGPIRACPGTYRAGSYLAGNSFNRELLYTDEPARAAVAAAKIFYWEGGLGQLCNAVLNQLAEVQKQCAPGLREGRRDGLE